MHILGLLYRSEQGDKVDSSWYPKNVLQSDHDSNLEWSHYWWY